MGDKQMAPEQIVVYEEIIKTIDLTLECCQREIQMIEEHMAMLRARRAEAVRKLPNEQRIDHLFDRL